MEHLVRLLTVNYKQTVGLSSKQSAFTEKQVCRIVGCRFGTTSWPKPRSPRAECGSAPRGEDRRGDAHFLYYAGVVNPGTYR